MWLVTATACAGIIGAVVRAGRQGWVLESDNAAIAINAFDTVHGHPRLLGVHSSAVTYAGIGDFYHPGPMLYWVSAVPAGLFRWSTTGFLFTTALFNCSAVVGVAWFARRRAGDGFAAGLVAATAVLVWSLGPEVAHDIWNPHIAVLPWLLTLVLMWSVIDGDRAALVVLAVAASFTLQNHFGYLPLLGPLLVVTAIGLVLRLRDERRQPSEHWAGARRRWMVAGGAASVVVLLCWLPVLIQQFTGDPANVSQLVRFVRVGSPRGRVGMGFAFDRLGSFLGAHPLWLERDLNFFTMGRKPSTADVVVMVALLALAVGLCAYHWRRGDRSVARLLGLVLVAVGLLTVATASLPKELSSFSPYNYRPWWPICVLLVTAMGWGVVRLPSVGRWQATVPRRAALGAVALVVALVAAVATVTGTTIRTDHGEPGFRAIRALNSRLRSTLPGKGPYFVVPRGGLAYISLENAVILDLVRHGYDVRTTAEREPYLGTFRRADPRRLEGLLVIASGPDADRPPPGGRLLMRVPAEPATTTDPATDYPVTAYLVPPSRFPDNLDLLRAARR